MAGRRMNEDAPMCCVRKGCYNSNLFGQIHPRRRFPLVQQSDSWLLKRGIKLEKSVAKARPREKVVWLLLVASVGSIFAKLHFGREVWMWMTPKEELGISLCH
ncbi:unnamed protein product [Prunus armeniaca]|uniref:Uncharacterized protein n=1 Tax=Prunus armeniaca TaxID=36596 RepID=A0A6J5Y9Y7_PRUAR|nr:unnamed protein product [Prunus armeniaca]